MPDAKVTGPDYTLPPGLAPLARHKADFTVVQGLTNKFANEAHWGSTFWLTGANRYAEPGQSFHNSISADQVVAERLGTDTRFASIQLSSPDGVANGHGPGLSLAWDARRQAACGHGESPGRLSSPVLRRDGAAGSAAGHARAKAQRARCRAGRCPTCATRPQQSRHRQTRRILSKRPRHRDPSRQGRAMAPHSKGEVFADRAETWPRRSRRDRAHV